MTRTTRANGTTEESQYNILGWKQSHRDANGNTTVYSGYDAAGRPAEVRDGDGVTTRYRYDETYKPSVAGYEVTGANPHSAAYAYDAFGNKIQEAKTVDGVSWQIDKVYTDTGELLEERDSISGMIREYDYDGWGRLRRLYLTRDGQKRLFLDVDGYTDSHLMRGYELPEYGVAREYSYNAQNDRITGIKDVAGDKLIVQDQYRYDGVGNRVARTLTRPNTRIPETQMVGVFAGSVTGGDDHPGQDPGSPGSSPTFVTNTTYEYDKLDRLISFIQENSDGVSFGKEYEYDKSGNMERDRWTGLDEYAVVKMRYKNDADQIESQWRTFQKGDGGWLDYEYDQHGSLTSITGRDNANTFMSHSYEWDARNRLVKAATRGVGGNSDSESLYDKDGLRYKHTVRRYSAQNSHSGLDPESSNGHSAPDAEQRSQETVEEVVSRYFYEDGGRLIAEQVGDTLYTYVHLGAHPVVRFNETRAGSESSLSAYHSQNGVLTDGNQLRDHSSEGLDMNDSDPARHNMGEDVIPASEVESPGSSTITTLLYHRDALGTTLATSFYDADLQQWKINPIDTLPYGQEASFHHAGTGQTGFEFTGKKRDKETYTDYFHARHYSPQDKRFRSPDPAGINIYEPKSINPYQFNFGDPVGNADPDGNYPRDMQQMFRWAWKADFGNTPEVSIANKVAMGKGVAVGVGDRIQAIPDPVLSGAGAVLGTVAIFASGPVGISAAVGSYATSGLSLVKTGLDYSENNISLSEATADLSLEALSTVPNAGPLVDMGAALYDTIKWNYEKSFRFDFSQLSSYSGELYGPYRENGSF